jgi:hypothetical protein
MQIYGGVEVGGGSFTLRPIYLWGKEPPRYPLQRRPGEPQNRSERCGQGRNLHPNAGRSYTELSRLNLNT